MTRGQNGSLLLSCIELSSTILRQCPWRTILPGIGPVTTIAMLRPITFKLPAVGAIIMLSGNYYGSHHSGSTTAIMLNMPGEPSSVVICIDGHPMARKGQAGPALAIAAIAYFVAGCVGFVIVAGPEVVSKHPDLFWGVIASMWIGNMMLLVLNLPMIGLWVWALLIPFRFLYPAILAFCCIGVFNVSNAPFDVLPAALFGFLGVIFKVLDCHPAPLVLAAVAGMWVAPALAQPRNIRRAIYGSSCRSRWAVALI